MSNNTFDEAPIRDTIKLLHEKLSLLFYLNGVESIEILQEINSTISKCDDCCISSCTEIIVPPIIMAIHSSIRSKFSTKIQHSNEISNINNNSRFCAKSSLQLEELLKILLNVLQKIDSNSSKIIFSRISMAFFDILNTIAKVIQVYINERNEFIIQHCIRIIHFNFNIFWEYWQHRDYNIDVNQHLIVPLTIQFLLTIAIPNTKEFSYPKEIRVLSLKLLSELPAIIKDIRPLTNVYPGVIQRLSTLIINSVTKCGLNGLIETSLYALIEWISSCLCQLSPETINYTSNVENIINTAKILNYIIKYKAFKLVLQFSTNNSHIYYFDGKAYSLKIKSFFITIANMCLTSLFDIFYDIFDELLITSLDFLVSLKCNSDYINPIVDKTLYSIIKCLNNNKMKLFFSNYSRSFLINFEHISLEKLTSVELDEENNLMEFIIILTKYIGFQKTENKFFLNIISSLSNENVLKFFLRMMISSSNLELYKKSTKEFNLTGFDFKLENFTKSKEHFNLKVIDVVKEVKAQLIRNHSDDTSSNGNHENIITNNILDAFQLYGDIFTLTFFDNKRLGLEKSRLISSLILKSISISILNLNDKNIDYKYIIDCLIQYFKMLNENKYEYNSMLDFIVRISLCNATQLILNTSILCNTNSIELPNFEKKRLPNIIFNWLDFVIEEINKDYTQQNLSTCREINRDILLILLGNLLLIARTTDIDKDICIRKLNNVTMKLISLHGYGSPIAKKITAYILDQVMHLLGHSSCKFSINEVINEYSVEIMRELEMMHYEGYSKEKVELILTALQHCKLEFIIELSDIIERFFNMNMNSNHWIFEFIAIITKRLSTYIAINWNNFLFYKIFKSSEIYTFKQKLGSVQISNSRFKEACYDYFLDYLIYQGNNILDFHSTQSFFIDHFENNCLDNFAILEDNLGKIDFTCKISNIQKITERMIHIIYSYASNIDGDCFSILDYQHLSIYSLLNCIFILSTEPKKLFPIANMIIPGIINQWVATINKIRNNHFSCLNFETIKLRRLYQTNFIIIQLIISCGEFAIKILEDKLIPLIREYIEFVFTNYEITEFIDDKESELNSEFQKLCTSSLEVLHYFTKLYLKLNAVEIKFETLSSIVNLLLSPKISFFSINRRFIVSKTILFIYFKYPSIINSKLIIQREKNTAVYLKETVMMIKFVENSLVSIFKNSNIIVPETRGELGLKQKINKF